MDSKEIERLDKQRDKILKFFSEANNATENAQMYALIARCARAEMERDSAVAILRRLQGHYYNATILRPEVEELLAQVDK